MSIIQDLIDESKAWAAIGGKPSDEEIKVRMMSLVEFLELLSTTDFKFRYVPGDLKTKGIEIRHEILKGWITRLKEPTKAGR
jgi:hypothetical protein